MAGSRSSKTLTLLAATLAASTVFAGPPQPVHIYGTGLDADGDKIYRITLNAQNTSELFASLGTDPSPGNGNSPNGIAVDDFRGLLFYSVADPTDANAPNKLYSIPLDTTPGGTPTKTYHGALTKIANGGAMYNGDYYYLDNGTNSWRKATLDDDGDIASDEEVCTAGTSTYNLGDIAGLQGKLYATVKDKGDDKFKLLTVDLENSCNVTEVEISLNSSATLRPLQLAWGVDYKLYGYYPEDEKIYVINTADGVLTPGPDYAAGPTQANGVGLGLGLVSMSDIDSLPLEARVAITKKTNGTDNNDEESTGPEITVGDEVTWTYEIANAGQLALTDVTVVDDKIDDDATYIQCDDDGDGTIEAPDEADNVIPTLAVGESTFCEATGTAALGPYTNTGTATADYTSQFDPAGGTVTDSDSDKYLGVEEEEVHDVALLVLDRDSIYDSSRCYKYKYGRCYKFRKDDPDDEDGDDDDDRKAPKSKKGQTLGSLKSWNSSELGSSDFGKRSVLPYFNNPNNFGTTVTLATGSIYKHSKYGSAEGWLAPDCIPQKWLSGAAENDNTCMTGDDRKQGINNFLFNGFTPYAGAPSSTSIPGRRLQTVAQVLPLRARGLKLLEGTKVCAVVYDGDIEVSYKDKHGKKYDYESRDKDDKGSKYGQEICAADNNVPGSHKSKKDDAPCIRGDLAGKTFGIVAFEVIEARDRDCKYCLPDVDVKVLDPAQTCNNMLLYNAPVPNGPKYPKDIAVDPLYDQVGYKKYRSLYYDPSLDLLF